MKKSPLEKLTPFTRREAIKRATLASLGVGLTNILNPASVLAANASNRKLRVAVVALGRGMAHVSALLSLPDVEIAYLAEVDPQRLSTGLKAVADRQNSPCKGVVDFRTCLEDKTVDAVFIATPNFWHTPAAVLSMQAGKHVYVEKPGSQNPHEAELIVASAKKYGRMVQMGNQRRTWMREAIAALHAGAVGNVRFARAFYYGARKAIGQPVKPAPADLDLNLWQGPVADESGRNIRDFVHYDWHWLWHWGNGELGNNGIHTLDILRWGLQAKYPIRISYNGGRYWHKDSQETPDTGTAVFDFGHRGMEWVQSSCATRSAEKPTAECVFYGDRGTFAISGSAWTIFDPKGEKIGEGKGPGGGDPAHIGNFLDSIREKAVLNSPIEEAQVSTMLCHLGNIAYRTNTTVQCDPNTGRMLNHPAGERLWKRPYRENWEPSL
jgi:predicted dehydrogenase